MTDFSEPSNAPSCNKSWITTYESMYQIKFIVKSRIANEIDWFVLENGKFALKYNTIK